VNWLFWSVFRLLRWVDCQWSSCCSGVLFITSSESKSCVQLFCVFVLVNRNYLPPNSVSSPLVDDLGASSIATSGYCVARPLVIHWKGSRS
jgi:hypothetical protein